MDRLSGRCSLVLKSPPVCADYCMWKTTARADAFQRLGRNPHESVGCALSERGLSCCTKEGSLPDLYGQFPEILCTKGTDWQQLVLIGKGETHVVRYLRGHEVALLSCLMDYAANPQYRLGWEEVVSVVKRLGL